VEVSALERVETAKGLYLAYRRRQRGKTAVDVLPDVLGGTLRALTFPKQMHWDALLEDGRGELLFDCPHARGPDRSGAGRHIRRRHLRTSFLDDQRTRRPGDQGALVR
jgi:hypothetical protein